MDLHMLCEYKLCMRILIVEHGGWCCVLDFQRHVYIHLVLMHVGPLLFLETLLFVACIRCYCYEGVLINTMCNHVAETTVYHHCSWV